MTFIIYVYKIYSFLVDINNYMKKIELQMNKSYITDEMKCNLLIYNKIIIKDDIMNKIMKIYEESNIFNSLKYMLMIISYLWYLNDKKVISVFINIFYKISRSYLDKYKIRRGVINNTINTEGIIIGRLFQKYFKCLKYIPDLLYYDISGIFKIYR